MSRTLGALAVAVMLAAPNAVFAFPFGGRASVVLQCPYNSTIYANLGPPRGGEFIWTTATKTYQFGPPSYAGQWLLGLAGAPYYCIYSLSPLIIYTGIAITMMGSSGSASAPPPLTRGPTPPTFPPTPLPPPSPTPPGPPPPLTLGKVVVSEVYYAVDAAHGAKPLNEWVELYNGSGSTVNLGGWKLEDATSSDAIPSGVTLASGKFLIVAATSSTRTLWPIPSDAQFISLGSSLGDGLGTAGDRIILRNTSGTTVDALSWGSNATAFNPSAPVASYGNSLSRLTLSQYTDSANDWAVRPPSPGK